MRLFQKALLNQTKDFLLIHKAVRPPSNRHKATVTTFPLTVKDYFCTVADQVSGPVCGVLLHDEEAKEIQAAV